MFPPIFSFIRKGAEGAFLKKAFPFFFVLCLMSGTFSGCDLDGGDPPSEKPGDITPLLGNWFSGTDGYEISKTTLFYDDGSNGVWGMSFTGNIRYVSNFTNTSGVIIVEYTSAPTSAFSTYTPPPNFIGIYYRILAPDMIKLANSYDTTNTDTPDLASAIEKFNMANESTFVWSWSGVAAQFKQAKPTLNLGDLEGTWQDTSDFGEMAFVVIDEATYTDIVDMEADGLANNTDDDEEGDGDNLIQFSGVIQETTDTSQNEGIIYIRLTNVDGFGGNIGEYYAVKWQEKSGTGQESKIEFAGADGNPQTSLALAKSYLNSLGTETSFIEYEKQ
jgi:hypothetical protein